MTPIIKYFEYSHLPPHLQEVSKPIGEMAKELDSKLPDGAEKSAGLRKLLEAKDCFVRALLPLLLIGLFASAAKANDLGTLAKALSSYTGSPVAPTAKTAPVAGTTEVVPATATASLVIKVSDKYACPPGEKAELEIVENLIKEKWRAGKHYQVIRSDEGPCPQFFWKGKQFASDGYTNWDDFRIKLYDAMGLPLPAATASTPLRAETQASMTTAGIALNTGERIVAINGQPVAQQNNYTQASYSPPVAQMMDQPTRQPIPPARRQWWMSGGRQVTDSHLRSHGIDPTGMSQAEKDRAHSHAHEGTWNAVASRNTVNYSYARANTYREYQPQPVRQVMRAFCPTCPR